MRKLHWCSLSYVFLVSWSPFSTSAVPLATTPLHNLLQFCMPRSPGSPPVLNLVFSNCGSGRP